jgi:glycosyltransferase involved in cell wall biosynthesis
MKIWVITTSYPREPRESINAGVLARDLALTVASRGHDVTVVTPEKPGGVVFDDGLSGLVLPWRRPTLAMADLSGRKPLDAARIASLFASSRRTLRRAAAIEPPDGVIALWALPSGIFARWVARWTGAPFVTWYLGSDIWRAPSLPMGVRTLSSIADAARATFADGVELAEEAERLTGLPVQLLRSARRMPAPPTDLPNGFDVMFVGRFHKNKGPDVLIEAFRQLVADQPGLKLVLRGQGLMREALVHQAASAGLETSVQVGEPIDIEDLAGAMTTARLLAIPSRVESMPLILGDAIQMGLPVVVSDVGDMGGFVRDHELGIVVPPEDPAALARALRDALGGEYPSPAGLESARQEVSPDSAADRLLAELSGRH